MDKKWERVDSLAALAADRILEVQQMLLTSELLKVKEEIQKMVCEACMRYLAWIFPWAYGIDQHAPSQPTASYEGIKELAAQMTSSTSKILWGCRGQGYELAVHVMLKGLNS